MWDIDINQFMGVEDNFMRWVNDVGQSEHYHLYNQTYCCTSASATLNNGPHAGESINGATFLGATNGADYYVNGGNPSWYGELNQFLGATYGWTTFTNGSLNGQSVATASALPMPQATPISQNIFC